MAGELAQRVRKVLQDFPDGLSTTNISRIIGASQKSRTLDTLLAMSDAYIDRWAETGPEMYEPIWCLVSRPADCPHPLGLPPMPRNLKW